MICAKAKTMFDKGNMDPTMQDSFLANNGWIQTFMKRNHPSCR